MNTALAAQMFESRLSGGTFKQTGKAAKISKAYVVGGVVPTLTLPAAIDRETFDAKLSAWLNTCPSRRHYVGCWYHDGTTYIDAVDLISNKENALMVARRRHELAIYDGANNAEITVYTV